jgi:protein phosphatase
VDVPSRALVVLIGPSGSGKSTFAARHFRETEVVSSDRCRALVSDDEGDQSATPAAFRVLHAILDERLRRGRRAVVDATNLHQADRRRLLELAWRYGRPTVAVVFDVPAWVCLERNRRRGERVVPDHVIRRQYPLLAAAKEEGVDEGFDLVHVVTSTDHQ